MKAMSNRDLGKFSFEQFFWSSSDLMSVVDLDGNFVLVNPAFRLILGWEPEDLVGQSYTDYIHPDDLGTRESVRTNDGVCRASSS